MLAENHDSDPKPHNAEKGIRQREVADAESQLNSDEDDARLEHVAQANEERVDGLLGFIFDLAARGQIQGSANRVHQRIVGAVFGDLHDAYDLQHR